MKPAKNFIPNTAEQLSMTNVMHGLTANSEANNVSQSQI